MGKRHTKPRTEVHIIHHYIDKNSSDVGESVGGSYNSNSEFSIPEYVNRFTRTNGQNIDRLEDIDRCTSIKLSKKDKSYSKNSILSDLNPMKSKRRLCKEDRTYSQPIIEHTVALHSSNENKLSRKSKTYSQHSISTSSSQGTSSSFNKIPHKLKSLSLASIAGVNKTSLGEEWDFDSNFFEDGSDISIARNSTIIEETSSIETIPEDMYIRYQSVRDLSRLFSIENNLSTPTSENENTSKSKTKSDYNESSDEDDTNLQTCSNPLEKQTLKPLEYMDHFEVDPYGCVVYTNAWNNMMWREALRRSSEQGTLEDMSTSSTMPTRMFGPPRIPKTPSRAINNMLESRCGKPFDNKPKYLVASVICGVFNVITLIYNQIHKDKLSPSHKMWMISCGVVAVAAIIASSLVYNIIVRSAFALHALLFYGCILAALVGVGLCVSGMVFFDKEASKEDFEKER